MRCPFCKYDDDRVIDSRAANEGAVIRRRRECLKCNRRFTTYERLEEYPLQVIKKSGAREPFRREKLLAGLLRACEKRPVSVKQLEAVADEIEQKAIEMFDREVSSSFLGEFVMKKLRNLDQVAFVRFASVYRDFKDVTEFLSEVKPIIEESGRGAPLHDER